MYLENFSLRMHRNGSRYTSSPKSDIIFSQRYPFHVN